MEFAGVTPIAGALGAPAGVAVEAVDVVDAVGLLEAVVLLAPLVAELLSAPPPQAATIIDANKTAATFSFDRRISIRVTGTSVIRLRCSHLLYPARHRGRIAWGLI